MSQGVLSKDDGSNEGCVPGEHRGSERGGRAGLPRGCGRCSKTEAKPLARPDPEEHTRPQQKDVLQTPCWPFPRTAHGLEIEGLRAQSECVGKPRIRIKCGCWLLRMCGCWFMGCDAVRRQR